MTVQGKSVHLEADYRNLARILPASHSQKMQGANGLSPRSSEEAAPEEGSPEPHAPGHLQSQGPLTPE